MDDAGIDAAVAQDSEDAAATGREAAAMTIPEAAEPLKVSNLNTLVQLVGPAMRRLVPQMPKMAFAEVAEDQPSVPADVGQVVLALGSMTQKFGPKNPALKPYIFDPVELMSTNDGLTEIGMIVDSMSRDEDAIEALNAPPGAGDEVSEEPVPEEGEEG